MKKQLTKSYFSKLAAPGQELPDEAIRCFATLILFHCDISGNHDALLSTRRDLSLCGKTTGVEQTGFIEPCTELESTIILNSPSPIEKKVNNGSGYWFHFAADFKIYDIPVLLCNSSRELQCVR